ncbi:MAG: response regulator [Methylocystaceae bacterium]|nr:response regulator [Methylocystaceae bacterium]
MGTYHLERLSVMLVEDNAFVRDTLSNLLRSFEIRKLVTCENGVQAIDFLKTAGGPNNPGGVDLIISDLIMSPANGLLLLRWVRAAKESPNRFMPFIMMSGAADNDYVNAARDMGVSEFLAKPFSVDSVYKRLMELIDYPRQFVTTHNYHGPDRRRRKEPAPNGVERREATDDDITIVYSGEKKQAKKDSGVWYFRLPNRLKEKVGGMGMKGGGSLPQDLLEQAEAELDRSSASFTDWALEYLSQLSNLCTEALLAPGARGDHFHKINLLAHELRGQGGTFGYPLISVFGKMLYECTMEGCKETDASVEVVKAHIDAMRAVLREKIMGDGGVIGRELLQGLQQAVKEKTGQILKVEDDEPGW